MFKGFLSGSEAGIERLTITSHHLLDCTDSPISTFIVQSNPKELSYLLKVEPDGTKSGNGQNTELSSGAGVSAPPEGFKSYAKINMDFTFYADATGILPIPDKIKDQFGDDNAPSIRKHLNVLQDTVYGYQEKIHGPPYLKLVWGKVFPDTSNKSGDSNPSIYKGTLSECKVTIDLFSLKGEPVKAKIVLTLNSAVDPNVRPLGASPDLTHYYDITHGEKMTNYCNDIYGRYDANICAAIAEYNGLVDWEMPAGRKMTFPSIHLLEDQYLHKYENAAVSSVLRLPRKERMERMVGKRRANQYFKTFGTGNRKIKA